MGLTVIVARADNGVIGADGAMPWHVPADLRRFRQLTMGKPMIMGRKTFDSLPGLLPGRRHIVITRNPDWQAQGAERAGSITQAIAIATRDGGDVRAMVIGGAEIIAQALPHADRIELTEIHLRPEGDVRLPPFAMDEWRLMGREPHPAEGARPAYDFVTLERIHDPG